MLQCEMFPLVLSRSIFCCDEPANIITYPLERGAVPSRERRCKLTRKPKTTTILPGYDFTFL